MVFPDTTIYKDPSVTAVFKDAKIEAFLRDWFIKKLADPDGHIADPGKLSEYISKIIPRSSDRNRLIEEARSDGITRPFLAKMDISFNSYNDEYCFEIPELGFKFRDTVIEPYIWDKVKDQLIAQAGGWGMIRLGYDPPSDVRACRILLLSGRQGHPRQLL